VAAAVLESLATRLSVSGRIDPATTGTLFELTALALIAFGLWRNRFLRGLWVVTLGYAMNTLAILANGGKMPVTAEALEAAGLAAAIPILERGGDALHVVVGPGTRLVWLSDIIPLSGSVISVGDILITIGLALAVVEIGLRAKHRDEKALG